jgi:hypothetical protein
MDRPDVIPLAAPLIKSDKPLDFFGRLRPVVRNDFVGVKKSELEHAFIPEIVLFLDSSEPE